jgi:hypothetical protein
VTELLPDHRPQEAHHDEEAAEQGDQADPAVRRVGARMRYELEADPEDDGPYDEQEREQELRVRVGDLADPGRPTLGGNRRPQDDLDHRDDEDRRDPERYRLLEGHQEELHEPMLAEGRRGESGL